MIFTSYFAKIKDFPPNVIPIAICAKVPDWYTGLKYSKLAPKYDMLMKYKYDHNEADYIDRFNDTILRPLDPVMIASELEAWLNIFHNIKLADCLFENPNYHVALICYEKPNDFCHRHLVAEWFRSHGIECKEWDE